MDLLIIAGVSFIASGLTLFSGFGLGTLLMPVVALFFPLEVAIAITALVHFSNNIFKFALMGSSADRRTVLRFGLPAVGASFVGAALLIQLDILPSLLKYQLGTHRCEITIEKLVIGALIITFVGLELSPRFSALTIDPKYLPWGGIISGFFGGLSGHQGAFRSMFLIKSGLSKEKFIASGIVIAVLVDLARLLLYGWNLRTSSASIDWLLVTTATLTAFLGAFIGSRLISKLTIKSIQMTVSVMLLIVGLGIMAGIV